MSMERENRSNPLDYAGKHPTLRKAFVASLPVMAGYFALGTAFGILLAKETGLKPLWALFMSITMYAGSMQFVGVELLATQASLISTVLMTFMVNARHLLYGITLLEKYRGMGKYKPYLLFGMTDETFALAVKDPPAGVDKPKYYFCITLLDHIYWIIGTTFGTAIGGLLREFNTEGIDFAMTALFVTIFVEQMMKKENRPLGAIGIVASIACVLLLGPEDFLIPAMLVLTVLLAIYGLADARLHPERAGEEAPDRETAPEGRKGGDR